MFLGNKTSAFIELDNIFMEKQDNFSIESDQKGRFAGVLSYTSWKSLKLSFLLLFFGEILLWIALHKSAVGFCNITSLSPERVKCVRPDDPFFSRPQVSSPWGSATQAINSRKLEKIPSYAAHLNLQRNCSPRVKSHFHFKSIMHPCFLPFPFFFHETHLHPERCTGLNRVCTNNSLLHTTLSFHSRSQWNPFVSAAADGRRRTRNEFFLLVPFYD